MFFYLTLSAPSFVTQDRSIEKENGDQRGKGEYQMQRYKPSQTACKTMSPYLTDSIVNLLIKKQNTYNNN